ncbi:MAG: lysophospholipid acyltransferase family protein [Patescibacteria group bacterium]|jgi:1-acyl-sn-glycerol-3-phosphate acyltransferase
MGFEKIGQIVGKTIGKLGIEHLKSKVENFDIETDGLENLKKVKEEAYLLVANHIIPNADNQAALNTGVSPDAFVLSKLVEDNTGRKIKVAHKADDGWLAESAIMRFYQKNIGSPFARGVSKGVGNIPIQKNPGSFNRDFVETIDKTIENKEPIMIFPEGNWYEDFSPDHKIEPGAAHIAKKYNLKIVPAYINGANSWGGEQKVKVSFGEPFASEGLNKQEISQKMFERIAELQKELNQKNQ